MKSNTHKWIGVFAMMMLLATGCKSKPKVVNPFPDSQAVAGWAKTADTRTFDPDNLWQYIDGDSEQYIKAGVVTTSTSDYKYQGKLEATVDVYTMSKPDGAKTILEADPQHGNTGNAGLGDAAHVNAQSVVFRKGPYLVRIVAYQSSPQTQQALLVLAHGVEAKL